MVHFGGIIALGVTLYYRICVNFLMYENGIAVMSEHNLIVGITSLFLGDAIMKYF